MIDLDRAPSEAEEDKDEMHTNHDEKRQPQPVKAMENPKKKPGRKPRRKPRQKPELEAASVKDGMEIAHSEAKMEEMAADPNVAQATSSLSFLVASPYLSLPSSRSRTEMASTTAPSFTKPKATNRGPFPL